MSQIMRGWLAFAAVGAGVIHLALVISSPLPMGIALGVLGAAEFAWGVLILAKDRVVLPRLARIGAIAPIIVWSLLVVAATIFGATYLASVFNFIPMAIATIFELFVAGLLSVQLRPNRGADAASPRTPAAGLYLLGMFVGAIAVAALTTPALAYTQIGVTNPHSEHGGGTVSETDSYNFNLPAHAGH